MKQAIIINFIWRLAERFGAQIIQFIVSIILARILLPEDYGIVALVLAFSQILQVFVDSGLGNALIQKKEADDLDFSSVFYFNVVWCLILYMISFVSAPWIARFYDNDSLTPLIRVLCLTIIISGVKNVQQAYVSRTLQFKKFFFATLGGTLISAVIGIAIARSGGGAWALIAQKLTNLFIDTLVLWITVKWRPKWIFSWKRLTKLLAYGWKLLAAALLDTIYINLRTFIIGKVYKKSDLAYYNQGNQFPHIIVNNVNASIDSVLFPVMSRQQDNYLHVKDMTRRAITISTYIMAPLMMGLVAIATPLIRLILTEKWLPCVPFLRIFCITYMFYPIHTANLNAIKAMGRSDLFLELEIYKKIIGIILLIITYKISVMAMAYSLLINSFTSQLINTLPNKKLLHYSYLEQLKDIMPNILLAVLMSGCVFVIQNALNEMHVIVQLLIEIILGGAIYILGSVILKNPSFIYLYDTVKQIFKARA